MAINAGTVYSEMVLDLSKFERNLQKAGQQMTGLEKDFKKAGDRMEKFGKNMTLKVTTPLVGLGAVAGKVGGDFQAAMSEVSAISGATGEDFMKLEEKAKQMGATTKFSASESAEALKYMAMAGWGTAQMVDGLDGVMMLAAASGEELGMVSDIVTDALTAFGMQASEAGKFADILAAASSNSNTNVGMMGETFKYVAPLAGSLGYTAEDTALAIGLMANSGVKGSQAGTALRSMLTRLIKPTKESGAAMDALGIKMTNADGSMKSLTEVMKDLRQKFKGLNPEQQAFYAAQIAGQEAMSGFLAIINAGEGDFNSLKASIDGSAGAAKHMSEIMEDNLQGRVTKLKSALEGLALQLFEMLLPAFEKAVDVMQQVVDWLGDLDPAVQKNILKFGAMAAAIGPLSLVMSKFTGLLSGTFGVLGKILPISKAVTTATTAGTAVTAASAAATGGFGVAVKGVLATLGPWAIGIGAAGFALKKLVDHVKETGIEVDLFGDEVSKGTQKAVTGFLDMEKGATVALDQMKWSGQKVTEEMRNTVVKNVEGMKNQVVGKLEEQKSQTEQQYLEMFKNSTDITEEEQKRIIELTTKGYDDRIKKTETAHKNITAIIDRAAKENRVITDDERRKIDRIKKEMVEEGIRVLSDGEKEQLAIMERLKAESGKISAQQAAEVVKNSKEQRDKTISQAEEEYNERLKHAAALRAEGSEESRKLADKVVEEAKRQYEDAVENAKKMHYDVVREAKAQAGEHVEQINWETGEIKSIWDKTKEWFANNPITRWIKTKTETPLEDDKQAGNRLVGNRAHGDEYWRGGWTWVGEQGRELLWLPQGTKIKSNQQSERMAKGAGGGITQNITINSPTPLSPSEIARKNLQVSRQLAMEWGL